MKKQQMRGFWFGFNTMTIILIVCFLFVIPLLNAFEGFAQTVDIFLKETATATTTNISTLSLELSNAEQTPLNAFEFTLQYNPKEITVLDMSPLTTLCEDQFVLVHDINNASGTAQFACGTLTPFSDTSGIVATINIQKHTLTTTTVSFATSSTHVLAHDGYGTDATRTIGNLILTSF